MIPDPDLVETNDARAQLASERRRARLQLVAVIPLAFATAVGLLYALVDPAVVQRAIPTWLRSIETDAKPEEGAAVAALSSSESSMPEVRARPATEDQRPSPVNVAGREESKPPPTRAVVARAPSPANPPTVSTGTTPASTATTPSVEDDGVVEAPRLPDVVGQKDDAISVLSDTLPDAADSLLPEKVPSVGDEVLDVTGLDPQVADAARDATKAGLDPSRTVVDSVGSPFEVPRLEVAELLHPEPIVAGLPTRPDVSLLPLGAVGSLSPAGPGGAAGVLSSGSGVAGGLQNGGGLSTPGVLPGGSNAAGLLQGLQKPGALLEQTLRR